MSRRAFLAGSGAAVVAWGCTSEDPEGLDGEPEPEPEDGELPLEDEELPLEDEEPEPFEEVPPDDDITGAEGPVDAVIVDADVPTGAAIFGWVNELVDLGIRRPGYEGGEDAEQWAVAQFEALGLEHVRRQPVTVTRWEPVEQSLRVQVGDDEPVELACTPMAHSPALTRRHLDLVPAEGDNPEVVAGSAVLQQVRLQDRAVEAVLHQGSSPPDAAGRVIDPDRSLAGERQVLPPGLDRDNNYVARAADAGAELVIGWLDGHPGDTHEVYSPVGEEELAVPGLWVSGSDGAWLRRQLATGPVQVTARIRTTSHRTVAYNVVGELPGAGDQTVMITSHLDTPWESPVAGASGAAMVLAQAKYWAAQAEETRPHGFAFVLYTGHTAGGVGVRRYIRDHADELDDVVLHVSLENAGLVVESQGAEDDPVVTDHPVPRWFFTSRAAQLESAVIDALTTEQVERSLLVAPDAMGDRPPTAGGAMYDEGVPLVHLAPAPTYAWDNTDALDLVDQDGLGPLTRAMVRVVASTAGVTAGALRVGTN